VDWSISSRHYNEFASVFLKIISLWGRSVGRNKVHTNEHKLFTIYARNAVAVTGISNLTSMCVRERHDISFTHSHIPLLSLTTHTFTGPLMTQEFDNWLFQTPHTTEIYKIVKKITAKQCIGNVLNASYRFCHFKKFLSLI